MPEHVVPMTQHTVTLRLNQQQLELIDSTVARGAAADRVALVRRALSERSQPAPVREKAPAPQPTCRRWRSAHCASTGKRRHHAPPPSRLRSKACRPSARWCGST